MIKSSNHVIVLNNIPFTIEEKKVLRELRFPPGVKTLGELREGHIASSIKNTIDTAYSLIRGRACYRTFEIKGISGDIVTISDSNSVFRGVNMVRLLKNCDYATLLVCTIGKDIVEKIEEAGKSSLADAYYLDRVSAWIIWQSRLGVLFKQRSEKMVMSRHFVMPPVMETGGWKRKARL